MCCVRFVWYCGKKKYGRHLVFHRDYVNVVETKPKADLEVERQMSFRTFYLSPQPCGEKVLLATVN